VPVGAATVRAGRPDTNDSGESAPTAIVARMGLEGIAPIAAAVVVLGWRQ
jgi:hypothetical protein